MKNKDELRSLLRSNTIHLIGAHGFEGATTKAIANLDPDMRINEVYIYRLFGSKDLLYAAAFSELDNELFFEIKKHAVELAHQAYPFRDRMHEWFDRLWQFLLGNEYRCRCYVRYYYSAYFREQSMREHRRLLYAMEEYFTPLFKEESDVVSLIHTTFMTMLDFAIRVYNGDLENTEDSAYHIFNLLYDSLSSYFNPNFINAE